MQSKTAGMTIDELLYSEIDLFSEREEVIYFYLAETWRTEYVLLTKDIDMAELRRSVGEPILQIHANLAECSTLQSFLTETVFYDGEAYRYRLRKDAFYREEVEDVCSEDFYGFRLVILEGVDAIGDGAFAGSCFSEVQMSDDVLSIGAGAIDEFSCSPYFIGAFILAESLSYIFSGELVFYTCCAIYFLFQMACIAPAPSSWHFTSLRRRRRSYF